METSILQTVAGGGSVAVLAVIIFFMYRSDKKEEAQKLKNEKEEEISRWQVQVERYEEINTELLSCRKADTESRESLSKNLGALAESIRSCGLRGGNLDN